MADQTFDFNSVTVRKREGQPDYELGVIMDGAFVAFAYASEARVEKQVGLAKIAADEAAAQQQQPQPPPAQPQQ